MAIWLASNMSAHHFVPKNYWINHFDEVRRLLPDSQIIVYESEGDIKAFLGTVDGYIAGIFVSTESQSHGIGKQLLDTIKQDYSELSLKVYKKNIRAVRFYQREQFIIKQEQIDEQTGETEYLMIWKRP